MSSTAAVNNINKVCTVCNKTGNLFLCSKCHITSYCIRECQVSDWKVHKKTCGKVIPAITVSIHSMIAHDDVRALEQALDSGQVHIDSNDDEGYTLLMLSCFHGKLKSFKWLLRHSANVKYRTTNGYTALIVACSRGHVELVQLLLTHNANVNDKNNEGLTSLMKACDRGYFSIVQLLLTHNANVNDINNNEECTALMYACDYGQFAAIKLLLSHGAKVNDKDNNGRTAIDYIPINVKGRENIVALFG